MGMKRAKSYIGLEKTATELAEGCLGMMESYLICMKITKISFKLQIKYGTLPIWIG